MTKKQDLEGQDVQDAQDVFLALPKRINNLYRAMQKQRPGRPERPEPISTPGDTK
jgi:hypothetical protein